MNTASGVLINDPSDDGMVGMMQIGENEQRELRRFDVETRSMWVFLFVMIV